MYTHYTIRGGYPTAGTNCGMFYVGGSPVSYANWHVGAALL